MFDFKSKPRSTNYADNNPFDKNGIHVKKLERFAADIIYRMREEDLSYHDGVIILQGIMTGLCAAIIQEKLMTKEELIPWVEDIFGETQKLIQKSV